MDAVEVTDPQTVVVKWREPFIEADTMFSPDVVMPMARHLLEQTYTQDKPNFLTHSYWRDEFVGTGPYRLVEWAPGTHLLLRANDQYILGRPRIDEIDVRFILDLNAINANLQAGTDIMPRVAHESPHRHSDAERKAGASGRVLQIRQVVCAQRAQSTHTFRKLRQR